MSLKVTMKDLNPGIFFLWPSSDPKEKGGITVRSLTDSKHREILKQTTSVDTEYIDGKPVEKKVFDEDKYNELMYDYCIVSWTGLEDDGKPVPCTAKIKMKLMREHAVFPTIVNTCIAIAKSERAMKDKEELKNFFRS